MRPAPPILALSAVTVLVTACASHPSVPTATRSGQSWVITLPRAAFEVLQDCGPVHYAAAELFAPTRQQIDQLETTLPSLAPRIPTILQDDRQYIGLNDQGQEYIYVRGFSARDHRRTNPSHTALTTCTEGWEALFDTAQQRFVHSRTMSAPQDTE